MGSKLLPLQFFRRLDVDEDVGDAWIAFLNGPFYRVRDVMAFAHRNAPIDFDVKIDIEAQTHFANQTLVDSNDAGN